MYDIYDICLINYQSHISQLNNILQNKLTDTLMYPNHQSKSNPNSITHFNSNTSNSTHKPNYNKFLNIFQQIKSGIEAQNYSIRELLEGDIKSETFLSSGKKYEIATHCNQYAKISPLIISILNGRAGGATFLQQQNFWQVNEGLQRELEIKLRDLKNIGNIIDNIVNQQFDKCNEIDQIEETIRIILSRKDPGHISKAEPYFQKKQQCISYLSTKKQEKQRIKDDKLELIKKIIDLLDRLKRHRENGLKTCLAQQNQRKSLQDEDSLIEKAVEDIRQIQKNEHKLANIDVQTKDLSYFINTAQSRIDKCAKELLSLLTQQNQASLKLQSLIRLKSQTEYFESSIFSVFGISNIRKNNKSQYLRELQNIINILQKYSKDMKQKQKQISKIQQGIQTTKRTLEIFDNIMDKIETQNTRKNQLLRDIQKMQQKHIQQDRILSTISQNENQLEKMKLRRNQLNKNLETKLNEANLTAYKTIHEEIIRLEQEIRNRSKQIQFNRQTVSQNARELYDQTMKIQQNYEDILSQVVPSIWLKGSDFTKEQAIKDLNLYLSKIFKRLSIAD